MANVQAYRLGGGKSWEATRHPACLQQADYNEPGPLDPDGPVEFDEHWIGDRRASLLAKSAVLNATVLGKARPAGAGPAL